jgi:hypothetical protein
MTVETQTIQNLLTQVSAIRNKYEEMAKLSGENFNVFKILGLTSNEVRTHSAFLAELLNPKGSHGQSTVFLELFLKVSDAGFIDLKTAFISIEESIGKINTNGNEGGRIDILIKDGFNNCVIIENKIYAGDQNKQLIRYSNFAEKFSKSKILYLTLYGSYANEGSVIDESTGKILTIGIDYFPISYNEFIVNWLNICKKEAVNHPILRETITQYINLIKILTNQNLNYTMNTEIIKNIIFDKSDNIIKENTNSVFLINRLINDIKLLIIEKFEKKLLLKLNNFEIIRNDKKIGLQDSYLGFYKKENDHLDLIIYIYFFNADNIIIGVSKKNISNEGILDSDKKSITTKISILNFGKDRQFKNWHWVTNVSEWNKIEWQNKLDDENIEFYSKLIKQISDLIHT